MMTIVTPDARVATLVSTLESDYRQLAHGARKTEGIASFFGNADDQPEVREAASRAAQRLGPLRAPTGLEGLNALLQPDIQTLVFKPLQLACDTKSPRLVSQALSILQKLISNQAIIPGAGVDAVIAILLKVERLQDEGVHLKMLQSSLTLFQSPSLHPQTEDGIASLLGLCFRSVAHKGKKETVSSTAAATVRQATALVFSYIDVSQVQGVEEDSGMILAAQRLLEDLIAIASGAPASWIKIGSLPRTFVLEVLDFALSTNTKVFSRLPHFESALTLRISQLLQAQLQDYLDAAVAGAGGGGVGGVTPQSAAAFKATLRCIETVLLKYHAQLKNRCATLIHTALGGLGSGHPVWQRLALAHFVRGLLKNPSFVYYLFLNYDMQRERHLDAMYALVRCPADVVDGYLRHECGLTMDTDVGTASSSRSMVAAISSSGNTNNHSASAASASGGASGGGTHQMVLRSLEDVYIKSSARELRRVSSEGDELSLPYLAYICLDALLAFTCTVEQLTDKAVSNEDEDGVDESNEETISIRRDVCTALVESTWRMVLAVLSELLEHAQQEVVVLALLKRYQGLTYACGILSLPEARNECLTRLCLPIHSSLGSLNKYPGSSNSPLGSPRAHQASAPSVTVIGQHVEQELLSIKNVQATRTLFNIAHRLCNVLDSGWGIVLEIIQALDRLAPLTTDVHKDLKESTSSDTAILVSAASRLLECSRTMDRPAVSALLSSLRDLSLVDTADSSLALNRMVQVLQYNVFRLYDLWGIFLSHIVEIIDDPSASSASRIASIDALGRVIIAAIGDGEVADAEVAGNQEHMLLAAIESLYDDHKSLRGHPEVRLGVLRVVLAVLQRHGERLTDGWSPLFRLLGNVASSLQPVINRSNSAVGDVGTATSNGGGGGGGGGNGGKSGKSDGTVHTTTATSTSSNSATQSSVNPGTNATANSSALETLDLAFQCVQIACNDHLPVMPFERAKRCLQVAVAYAEQRIDVNVSLTAISLLWNVGDSLVLVDPAPVSGSFKSLDAAAAEQLLQLIFLALQGLSQDPRPEVRNAAGRTLFAIVVARGPRLSRALWESSLWQLLFPLLRHAFNMSATSSREESEAGMLGRLKGGAPVRLVVHHSRNTEQKLWDETVVVALTGMTKLLKAHLPAIATMDGVESGWDELMVVTESSLAGGRKEVALAALGLLGSVLGAHGGDDTVITFTMWSRAVRALDVGVEAATSAGCQVPLAVRTELVSLLGTLATGPARYRWSSKSEADFPSLAGLFRWLEALAKNPWSEDDASNPVQTVGMPPVQKAVLALLPGLAPEYDGDVENDISRGVMETGIMSTWRAYLATILRLVAPEHAKAQAQGLGRVTTAAEQAQRAKAGPLGTGTTTTVSLPPKRAQHRFALTIDFIIKVLEVLEEVYAKAPAMIRVETFPNVMLALRECMEVSVLVCRIPLCMYVCMSVGRSVGRSPGRTSCCRALCGISAFVHGTVRVPGCRLK
jgi:hypothetical protein